MCRIAGVYDISITAEQRQDAVKKMCTLLKHGGPDDEGIFTQGNLTLGNRRLALLDLSVSGHQPMHYKERFTITYNGEVYNFIELKEELTRLGHHFSTGTDTEVILAAFAQWHTQSFERLNGMFAFAITDKVENKLYLVRDASGIKPLYYLQSNTGIAFASETRALQSITTVENNSNWPVFQLAYGHLPEPVTQSKDIIPLKKGCFYQYDLNSRKGMLQVFKFHSFSKSTATLNSEETTAILQRAVDRHLVADAPVGTFLSGGLDSSILTCLAHKSHGQQLKSLSLYFDEPSYSEKEFQDAVVSHLKCNHSYYLLSEKDFHLDFETILDNIDLPSCDGINTWFISRFAAQNNLKAVLSGIGSDEIFGGYPSFNRMAMARQLQHCPDALLAIGKRGGNNSIARTQFLQIEGIAGIYLFLRGHFTPPEIARQLGMDEKEVWSILQNHPSISCIHNLKNGNLASWLEFNLYMQNQLLRDTDVMGMAHGIEIRVPFLDDELLAAIFSLNENFKFQRSNQKHLLISAFKNSLPEKIWNRPKMGFSLPFKEWLANNTYVQSLLETGNQKSQKLFQEYRSGRLHWSRIMSLVLLRRAGYC